MRLALLVLVLTGCGPSGYVYTSSCVSFDSEIPLDIGKVDLYVNKAESIFEKKFGQGTFCSTVKNSSFVVLDKDSWEAFPIGSVVGLTDFLGNVTLSRNGQALLHETIHVYEIQKGITGTATHFRWNYLGYVEMSREFGTFAASLGGWELRP